MELEKEYKTYLKFLQKNIIVPDEYQNTINKIRLYDISRFEIFNNKPYNFIIKPDIIFIDLIKELNNYIKEKLSLNIEFNFTYDVWNLNRMEFEIGIPEILQNTGLGYKLYVYFIKNIKFVVSDKFASPKSIHVWRYLIMNNDFYSFTSNDISGLILKNQTNKDIKNILDRICDYDSNVIKFSFNDIIFDEELEEKIKDIYGTLDLYKQKN
jgi:hypothetical protein